WMDYVMVDLFHGCAVGYRRIDLWIGSTISGNVSRKFGNSGFDGGLRSPVAVGLLRFVSSGRESEFYGYASEPVGAIYSDRGVDLSGGDRGMRESGDDERQRDNPGRKGT